MVYATLLIRCMTGMCWTHPPLSPPGEFMRTPILLAFAGSLDVHRQSLENVEFILEPSCYGLLTRSKHARQSQAGCAINTSTTYQVATE